MSWRITDVIFAAEKEEEEEEREGKRAMRMWVRMSGYDIGLEFEPSGEEGREGRRMLIMDYRTVERDASASWPFACLSLRSGEQGAIHTLIPRNTQ